MLGAVNLGDTLTETIYEHLELKGGSLDALARRVFREFFVREYGDEYGMIFAKLDSYHTYDREPA